MFKIVRHLLKLPSWLVAAFWVVGARVGKAGPSSVGPSFGVQDIIMWDILALIFFIVIFLWPAAAAQAIEAKGYSKKIKFCFMTAFWVAMSVKLYADIAYVWKLDNIFLQSSSAGLVVLILWFGFFGFAVYMLSKAVVLEEKKMKIYRSRDNALDVFLTMLALTFLVFGVFSLRKRLERIRLDVNR